jgi:hypothetical protein
MFVPHRAEPALGARRLMLNSPARFSTFLNRPVVGDDLHVLEAGRLSSRRVSLRQKLVRQE